MLDHLICVLNQSTSHLSLEKNKFKYSERNEIIELMVYLHYSGEPACLQLDMLMRNIYMITLSCVQQSR